MPNVTKQRERMAITLNPEMYSLIGELAELQSKTKTTVVAESLEAARPALEAMRNALVDLKQGVVKEQVLARMLSHSLRGVADNLELDLKQNLK
jgi:predicted DNA-binding protein